ncbi:lactoylglutathione lyase [Vibrio parahaemolyticus]|uniref:lactoylglutathione lyase n=1 Tax=Vibrio parahaemolyticus TaxID=670 RepID=UPI00226B3795|nr:lactoylglutathione lyase [Vibrio parahaemolyticus]MCX8773065.1 lactoylglutathione lyase [Vibrio parahaemolyticus]
MSYALVKSLSCIKHRYDMPHPIIGVVHFKVKVAAFEECRAFYMNALEPLGIELKWSDENAAGFGLSSEPNVRFLIEEGVSNSTCHIAFSALDKRQVTAFHEAGLSSEVALLTP